MKSRPPSENPYADVRTKIRNADSHAEAEAVLEHLSPSNIEDVCRRLVEQRGDGTVYEDENFVVVHGDAYVMIMRRTKLGKTSQTDSDPSVVFLRSSNSIETFDPIRCWNVLNFLEEIISTGSLSI